MKHLTVFLLLISASLSAQITNFDAYYAHANKGNYYYYKEKYDSALVEFTQAFKHTGYIHAKYLNKAITSAKKIKNKTAFNELNALKTKQAERTINTVYKAKIDSLFKVDQTVVRSKPNEKLRLEYLQCIEKNNCDSSRMLFFKQHFKKQGLVDSTNIAELVRLIGEYGFPSEQRVGGATYEDAMIMLAHYDYDQGNKILQPILYAALKTGDMAPKDYGWIVDRRSTGDPVYYIIPMGLQEKSKDEVEAIDQRRQSIGMPKIADSQVMIFKKNSVRVKYLD